MPVFGQSGSFNWLLCRWYRSIASVCDPFSSLSVNFCPHLFFSIKRRLTANSEWAATPEFGGLNAYDVLRVSQNSSFAEIKSSFRKLAKETHPDLAQSQFQSSDANRFLQIVAAYEILSDSTRRAHYDSYLARGTFSHRSSKKDTSNVKYYSYKNSSNEMDAVEWLKWYRYTIKEILSERRVTAGSKYFDVLERDFYSAIHAAYYGPNIESMDLLPDCFEAEERSTDDTSEVLHLVSGRDLFGMVCVANRHGELPYGFKAKLRSPYGSSVEFNDSSMSQFQPIAAESKGLNRHLPCCDDESSAAYADLELHISGKVIATATRVPCERSIGNFEDQISVFLNSHGGQSDARHVYPPDANSSVDSRVPLGFIKGLGMSYEEGFCYVYNITSKRTHMIVKHRTLLVKHLHWFQIGEKVSVCECRCSRACLLPSRFWLFEPRSAMHDAGGWYVETFGRDNEGHNVPAHRHWDCFHTNEKMEKRLHPAMYLLALAYRTLDLEQAKRRKMTIKERIEAKVYRALNWYIKGY